MNKIYTMMQGQFSSEKQSKTDPSYYHISLKMVPIWKNNEAKWLYVEQAMASATEKPYRQRIYKVEQIDQTHFVSKVYELPKPEKYINKFNEESFKDLKPEELLTREGCAVYLTYNPETNTFEGSTKENNCVSNLKGAKYATSKVMISSTGIKSWDQGFDENGKQVWGAVKGGYIFDKIQNK